MTGSVIVAIVSLAVGLLIAASGAVFGYGRCRSQIDTNSRDIKGNRQDVTALAFRINGSLDRISSQLGTGNRELGALTEAVNTLKGQQAELTKRFNDLNAIVAEVCGKLDKD